MKQPNENHILQLMKPDLPEGFTSYKIKTKLGEYPDGYGVEWWTEEDWEQWSRNREGYIFSGEFGKEVEYTLNFAHNPAFENEEPIRVLKSGFYIPKGSIIMQDQKDDFSDLMQSPMYNPPTVEELQAEIDRLNARVKDLESQLLGHHKSYFY